MARIITLLNQKGGVGKTSTTHHLAGTYAAAGRRVLVVDNDPQASLTQGFLGPAATRQIETERTLAGVYAGDAYPEQVVRPSGAAGVDLVPGSKAVGDWNVPRPYEAAFEHQTAIREFLTGVAGAYDTVMIDCPPNLCLCSWAALIASDYMIVPLQAEDYGAQGIIEVSESIDLVKERANPNLTLLGYLLTMHNARLGIHQMYERILRETYGDDVFRTTVPIATDFKEAIAGRLTIAQHKPKGAAAKVMRALAAEIDERVAAHTGVEAKGAA